MDLLTGTQIQHGQSGADQIRKDLAVAEITIVEKGELITVTRLDADDASRVGHRGNPQENGGQGSKERRVDANPEAKREGGYKDENRTAAQAAPGVDHISNRILNHGYAPRIATLFLVALNPAEVEARLSLCLD